ncbi:MAG: hypothetical protein Kow0079_08800 [Vicingaceae bacterium]
MLKHKNILSRKEKAAFAYFQILDHFLGREKGFKLTEKKRRKVYQNLYAKLKSSGEGKVLKIDRVKNISLREFKEKYQKPGIPVIFDGLAKDWKCVKDWNLDYFINLHGDDKILVVDQEKIILGDNYKTTTLREVLENIKKGESDYYRFYPLLNRHPEHIKDFDYKWLIKHRNKPAFYENFQAFIGGDQTKSVIHNAAASNIFVQVHGVKEWRLYPIDYSIVIDPYPIKNIYRSAPYKTEEGPFDPFNPNYENPYSLYKYIDSYEAVLNPGDVLWNPPYWWHTIVNHGETIGVGYRWVNPFHYIKMSPLFAFLDLFATSPPIWKAYKIGHKNFHLMQLLENNKLDDYLKNYESQ